MYLRSLRLINSILFTFAFTLIASGQAVKVDRIASSFNDTNIGITVTLNQQATNYQSASLLSYKVRENVSNLSGIVGQDTKTLVFSIPLTELKAVPQIEYQATIKKPVGTVAAVTSWTQLDLRFLKTLASKDTEIGNLNGERTTWAKKELDYQTESRKKDLEIESLRAKYQATQFNSVKSFSTDTLISVAAALNNVGEVKGEIECLNCDAGTFPKRTTNSTWNKEEAILTFGNLFPAKKYKITMNIVDVQSKTPMSQYKYEMNSVNTEGSIGALSLEGEDAKKLSPIDSGNEELNVRFKSNDVGFVRLVYAEQVGDGYGQDIPYGGKFEKNQYSIATGGIAVTAGDNTIPVKGLKPGKTYKVEVYGMNRYGNESGRLATNNLTVPQKTALDFDNKEPLTADISPLKMTLTWKSNLKPEKAEFVIEYPNPEATKQVQMRVASMTTFSDDLKISLTLDKADAFAVHNANTKNAEKEQQTKTKIPNPTVVARMYSKDGSFVERRIQMSYTVPKAEEVNQTITGTDQASKDLKKDILDVVSSFAGGGGGKIQWGKLFKSGLSFFIKAVL